MRLVPVGKLTFPDQQQDLQNAADSRVTGGCDRSVKFPGLVVEADSRSFWLPDRVWVGWGVSDLENSLCDQLGWALPTGLEYNEEADHNSLHIEIQSRDKPNVLAIRSNSRSGKLSFQIRLVSSGLEFSSLYTSNTSG